METHELGRLLLAMPNAQVRAVVQEGEGTAKTAWEYQVRMVSFLYTEAGGHPVGVLDLHEPVEGE